MDKIGDYFKQQESLWEGPQIPTHQPVILRLDGKAFHTYTRIFDKPFDSRLHDSMIKAAAVLCKEIQNARFAYTQSDEISILIYEKTSESETWYGNRPQKMVSVAASVCTTAFNREMVNQALNNGCPFEASSKAVVEGLEWPQAHFDARVFGLDPEKVQSYFSWRQEDCTKNSISMLAQSEFSHKQLHKKNRQDMLEMLNSKKVSWARLEDWKKFGSIITKQWIEKQGPNGELVHRSYWDASPCVLFDQDEAFFNEQLSRDVVNT